jgi:hypothetical protein
VRQALFRAWRRFVCLKQFFELKPPHQVRFISRQNQKQQTHGGAGMKRFGEAEDNLGISVSSRDNAQSGSRAADTLSQEGAMALAKRLQRYWEERSYPAARFWTEPIGERFVKVGSMRSAGSCAIS